jgi:hypothetical protein
MRQTIMDKEKIRYLKRFHTLLGKTGGDTAAKKEAILSGFGVDSSRDLNAHELLEACAALELELNPQLAEMDKWRKRVIASIGGWLKAMQKNSNIELIKAIACQAAGVGSFNNIPLERLRSLYYAFNNKQKDLQFTTAITADEINLKIGAN